MSKERIGYLDTAKGIGIILVCIGHACTNQAVVSDCKFAGIISFVTLFHMALFFFINGILYNEKNSLMPVHGIIKKFKAYYIPFVTYNLIFWVFHNLFAKLDLISGQLDSKDYAYMGLSQYLVSFVKTLLGFRQRFAGAMWFLECLIIISFVFIIIDFVITKWAGKKRILGLTICVTTIVLINHLFNLLSIPGIPSSLSQMLYWGLNGLLFFYLGYLYKYYDLNNRIIKYKRILPIIVFFFLICVVIVIRPRIVSVITNSSIPVYQYGLYSITGIDGVRGLGLIEFFIFSCITFIGIIMVLLFSQWKMITENNILKIVGKYSLHIMCLQFLAFKPVSMIIIALYKLPYDKMADYPVIKGVNGLWWIVYTIAACVIPIFVIKIYEKIKEILKANRK